MTYKSYYGADPRHNAVLEQQLQGKHGQFAPGYSVQQTPHGAMWVSNEDSRQYSVEDVERLRQTPAQPVLGDVDPSARRHHQSASPRSRGPSLG